MSEREIMIRNLMIRNLHNVVKCIKFLKKKLDIEDILGTRVKS